MEPLSLFSRLPSYFFSSVKNNSENTRLQTQTKESVPLVNPETLSSIKDLNDKLSLIEKTQDNKFVVSEKVINAIILKKMSSIKITNIAYENSTLKGATNKKASKKISIQGYAPSREVLLSFRQALENSVTFKQVDLPISNFVKGSNIQFYLSLILE